METKTDQSVVGKFERLQPILYANRLNCPFSVYELHMLKNALDADQRDLERFIENSKTDSQKYDLLEMKLKRGELMDRVVEIIRVAAETKL